MTWIKDNKDKFKSWAIGIVIWGAVIGGGFYWYHTTQLGKKTDENKKQAQQQQKDAELKDLINRNGANSAWDKDLVFSYQIQDVLANSTKPFYLKADLWDIYKKDKDYYAVFNYTASTGTNTIWELKIDKDSMQLLEKNKFISYHILAQVNSISRNQLRVTGNYRTDSGTASDPIGDGGVDLSPEASDTLLISGDLIQVMISE